MEKKLINEKEVLEYIKSNLEKLKEEEIDFDNDHYHHNSSYDISNSILENGILSIKDQHKLGIIEYTDKLMSIMSDVSSHANGINGISFSKVGLDDLYKDELEYNPYFPHRIDFIVSKELKARRYSVNYGNEFITEDKVPIKMLKSIDTRLIELINKEEKLEKIVPKYNKLIELANLIKELNLELIMRETSHNKKDSLNIEELSNLPQIQIKKA